MKRIPILLDTDIGDDIDDAYALSLILGSPELDLRGVTTVFGSTPHRTRQAQTLLKLAGRPEVPVASGCGEVLSVRQHAWPKPKLHEGLPYSQPAFHRLAGVAPVQDASALPAAELPTPDPRHGVDLLIETIMEGGGDVVPVAIGAFTNIAMALVKEPRIRARIPRIVVMGGVFDRQYCEWNIRCDPTAAAIVAESGVPMRWVGLDVTLRCVFDQGHLDRLGAGTRSMAKNLAHATRLWQGSHSNHFPTLHDPLAVETLFRPDLVKTKRGKVSVELGGDATYGYTTFKEDAAGPHEICTEVDASAAIDLWLERVLA
jgi:purine nucleosidase/pyrimidine-specific ribonucleoside hydrolase